MTGTRLCACGCGQEIPAFYVAHKDPYGKRRPRLYFDRQKCRHRANYKPKTPPAVEVECVCGCGKRFLNKTKHGRPRRFYGPRCHRPSLSLSPQAMQNKRNRERRRREAGVGRICMWCESDDSDGKWGTNQLECDRCRRQRGKLRCGKCDGPFYRYRYTWPDGRVRPAGCVARCHERDPWEDEPDDRS